MSRCTLSPVIEELKNLKKGKKGKWAKSVNRKSNHWIYSYVLKRIEELCEVAGVQWHAVPPQYTSKMNRNRDVSKCLRCGHQEDRVYSPSTCETCFLSSINDYGNAPLHKKTGLGQCYGT